MTLEIVRNAVAIGVILEEIKNTIAIEVIGYIWIGAKYCLISITETVPVSILSKQDDRDQCYTDEPRQSCELFEAHTREAFTNLTQSEVTGCQEDLEDLVLRRNQKLRTATVVINPEMGATPSVGISSGSSQAFPTPSPSESS